MQPMYPDPLYSAVTTIPYSTSQLSMGRQSVRAEYSRNLRTPTKLIQVSGKLRMPIKKVT